MEKGAEEGEGEGEGNTTRDALVCELTCGVKGVGWGLVAASTWAWAVGLWGWVAVSVLVCAVGLVAASVLVRALGLVPTPMWAYAEGLVAVCMLVSMTGL